MNKITLLHIYIHILANYNYFLNVTKMDNFKIYFCIVRKINHTQDQIYQYETHTYESFVKDFFWRRHIYMRFCFTSFCRNFKTPCRFKIPPPTMKNECISVWSWNYLKDLKTWVRSHILNLSILNISTWKMIYKNIIIKSVRFVLSTYLQ